MHTTPVSLLARLRKPDAQEAWDRFVMLYTPFLVHLLVHRLRVRGQDVADLVQDVFVTLVRILPNFEYDPGKGQFRGYLRQICCSRLADWRRQQPPRPQEADLVGLEDKDHIAELWEQDHNRFLTRRALEVMQTDFQSSTWKACWESVVHGRPAADVAKELSISENAVYIANFRVLRRLKEELEGLVEP